MNGICVACSSSLVNVNFIFILRWHNVKNIVQVIMLSYQTNLNYSIGKMLLLYSSSSYSYKYNDFYNLFLFFSDFVISIKWKTICKYLVTIHAEQGILLYQINLDGILLLLYLSTNLLLWISSIFVNLTLVFMDKKKYFNIVMRAKFMLITNFQRKLSQ